jgi:hypothetical protein
MAAGRDDTARPARDASSMPQEPDLTAAVETSRRRRDEDTRVYAWQIEQLERLGIPRMLAYLFARRVDWHQVAALVECGCPPHLALDIVR